MHDLVLTGGTVVDGTGRPSFPADVAVRDGRIVAVGADLGPARETIDATGCFVTPGWVDIHTHYDGQATWDADMAPSSLHGVTTAVLGSCGVGFAPVRDTDHARLIELMEGVEDIPGTALSEGLTWGWSDFPSYLDALDRTPRTMDLLAHVPHDALRVYVMGDRAVAGEPATDADIAQMRDLLRGALEAGAVGFTVGRTDNHCDAQGRFTPTSEADARELEGIAAAFQGVGHRVLQAVSDFDMMQGDEHFAREFDLLEGMARAAGAPLSVSTMERDPSPRQWTWILDRITRANAAGLSMKAQVAPRAIGVMLGLRATFHPFMGFPSYKAIHALPLAERVAKMSDPAFKAQMLSEKHERVSGDGSPLPPLADLLLAQIDAIAFRMFRLGRVPDYEQPVTRSLGAEAAARGVPAMSVIYDALLEDGGEALLYFPLYNYTQNSLAACEVMLHHPHAIPGLSDGGAHVGTICDASFPTFLLQHWVRDRPTGRLSVERAVQMLSHDTARWIGLHDRGTVEVGMKADLNVIDLARLQLRPPALYADLPAGGRRLLQHADGYVATVVSGVPTLREGALTGARPGRLVRAA